MPPNEQARKTHEELFPGHISTLAVTDPDLIETFDEVLGHGGMDARTWLMIQWAAAGR